MKSLKYLNTILTILTLLLGLQLWTQWTGMQPSTVQTAQAAVNPAVQRQEMVALLKKLTVQTEELTGLFRNGQARVRVELAPKAKRSHPQSR